MEEGGGLPRGVRAPRSQQRKQLVFNDFFLIGSITPQKIQIVIYSCKHFSNAFIQILNHRGVVSRSVLGSRTMRGGESTLSSPERRGLGFLLRPLFSSIF